MTEYWKDNEVEDHYRKFTRSLRENSSSSNPTPHPHIPAPVPAKIDSKGKRYCVPPFEIRIFKL